MASTENITTTMAPNNGDGIGCTPSNIFTISGILKCIELLLAIIIMICVTQDEVFYKEEGGGWVLFVTAATILVTIAMLIIYILNIIARVPSWWCMAEFVYYMLFTWLFVTVCIVAARAQKQDINEAAIDAAIFFSFVETVLFHVDTFLRYHEYRLVKEE